MTMMASQVTSRTVVYSTVYSDPDQRKHQSSASLAFVWGIHRDRWIPRTKDQLRGKYFHLMTSSCLIVSSPRTVLQPQRHWISNKSQPERLQKPLLIPIVIICRTFNAFFKTDNIHSSPPVLRLLPVVIRNTFLGCFRDRCLLEIVIDVSMHIFR